MRAGAKIDPGRLGERVTPQVATDAPDGAGGAVRTWQSLDPLWAEVRPLSANPEVRAARRGELRRYEITVRGTAALRPGMRLLWRMRTLHITATRALDAKERYLLLLCEERP